MRFRIWFSVLVTVGSAACSDPQNLDYLSKLVDAGADKCDDAGELGEVCSVGVGACERAGSYECADGGVQCSVAPGAASDELCDTKQDEDCDGKVDEAPADGCCADSDCKSLEVCSRPKGDSFAAGACKPFGDVHADCKEQGGKIMCVCQKGYVGDGKTCERDACVALPGEPAPCGAHEVCKSTQPGKKTCSCATGHGDCDGDGANGCEVDLDNNAKHCGTCDLACASDISCEDGACAARVKEMALGVRGTLAISSDEKVFGWGQAAILYGATDFATTPSLQNVGKATLIAQGESHACIVRSADGIVACWGTNTALQLGVADTKATHAELPIDHVTAISAGQSNTCVVAGDMGKVYCWGTGTAGILDGTVQAPYDASTPIAGVADAIDVGLGYSAACALKRDGHVLCWGNTGGSKYAPEPVRQAPGHGEPQLEKVVALRVGLGHACALREDKSLVCWGSNDQGQLGNGTATSPPRDRYVDVDLNKKDVAGFSCGGAHSCALTADGLLYCWGANNNAALGVMTASYQSSAWPLKTPLKDVTAVFGGCGAATTCATVRDGRLYCWGHNYYCELGLGPDTCPSGPPMVDPTEVTAWP